MVRHRLGEGRNLYKELIAERREEADRKETSDGRG